MDFMERLFGVSPDGGNGLYELCIITMLAIVAAMFIWKWSGRYRSRGNRGPK